MISDCEVPKPVKLNCWKHHLVFIKEQLSPGHKNVSSDELRKILLQIGESQMDLYLGRLTPKQISSYIIKKLELDGVFKFHNYLNWVSNNGENYREITLPDKSIWILRKGNEKERYIHIHPGRYSPLTLRIKSLAIKSAIVLIAKFGIERSKKPFLNDVNSIRKEVLNQPPLKSLSPHSGLGKIILLLCG